jgi:hypothetical protein
MGLASLWAWSSREGWAKQSDASSNARFKNVLYASTSTRPEAAVPLRRPVANGNTYHVYRQPQHRRAGDIIGCSAATMSSALRPAVRR